MKIKVKNEEKIDKAIDLAQERAQVRRITASDVTACVKIVEMRLASKGLPKNLWVGMRFVINPCCQKFPKAYKYCPESTIVELTRFASGWFVTGVCRGTCTEQMLTLQTRFTPEQAQAILLHAQKNW